MNQTILLNSVYVRFSKTYINSVIAWISLIIMCPNSSITCYWYSSVISFNNFAIKYINFDYLMHKNQVVVI